MEWFQPQPASIASLAECMFSLAFTLYLLSIPRKSKDGWLITVHYGLFTALYAAAFLSTASQPAHWHNLVESGQFVILAFNTTYNMWFAYAFRQNPFRAESRWVVASVGGLYAFAVIAGKGAIIWTFPLFLFGPLWMVITFVRKAVRALCAELDSSGRFRTRLGLLWSPGNGETRVYRDFALCYLVYFLVSVDASLGNLKLILDWWYVHVQLLIFLFLTLEMLTYVKHAKEATTFLVKLVGIFLCLTMVLLGLMGFMLYGAEALGRGDQQELYKLTLLIPVATGVIVLGAPPFFRSNLLRPLGLVVEGVQRVDRGDLAVQVPVAAQDELGTLADSFNRMTRSLWKYANQMDLLVQERTGELEYKSNALLQQQEELQLTLEQLKAAQTQLLAADAEKTHFFDNLTHEFRTPLTLILAPVERLLRPVRSGTRYAPGPGSRGTERPSVAAPDQSVTGPGQAGSRSRAGR